MAHLMGPLTSGAKSRAHLGAGAATLALVIGVASSAASQPAPGRPTAPPAPAQPGPAAPAQGAQPAQPTPPTGKGTGELGPGESTESKPDPLATALAAQAGGLTPDGVAKEAMATSPTVRSKEAQLEGARGQTEQNLVQFFPRLSFAASYTRLSDLTPPSLGAGGIVGTANTGALTVGACPTNPAAQCVLDSKGLPAQSASFKFPVLLNEISFTASLDIPISDYFLRTAQAYSAAQHNEESLKIQVDAQNLQTAADAKLVYLQWITAKGLTVVTHLSVEDAEKQVQDGKTGVAVGTASPADEMRLEARLAQAQFQESEAKSVEATAAERLRTVMHAPAERQLAIGIDVLAPPTAPTLEPLDALIAEGVRNRLELRALDEERASLDQVSTATNAGYLPRLDAFADAQLSNPNQRIIPQEEKFFFTWDVGARLTWTLNDTFSTIGAKRTANSHTAEVEAQRDALADAVRVEVADAYADLAKAEPSIEAADRGVAAAQETLRVTKKLFAFGKATGTQVVDAETDLTSAQLRRLTAHVNLIAAQIRLNHAVGRDMPKGPGVH